MDDEIIYSWCFHDVECFDSTPSAAIIILDKDLESFSSLRSQQPAVVSEPGCALDKLSNEPKNVQNGPYPSVSSGLLFSVHC